MATPASVVAPALALVKAHPVLCVVAFFVLRALGRRWLSPLRDVPNMSFLAPMTRLGRVQEVLSGDAHGRALRAHRKYGPIVRIGPNEVSISDPACIPIIYDNQQRWRKTQWYEIFGFPTPAHKNTFSQTDPTEHKRMKRNVASAYSMSSLVSLEPFVDSTIALFLQRLDELTTDAGATAPANLVKWFQWYAFDVVGELSFSRRLGFLDRREDVGGTCKLLDTFIAYTSSVAMVPEAHKWLLGNPIIPLLMTPPASVIADIANEEIAEREKHPERQHRDIVSKFFENQAAAPADWRPGEVFAHASVNISAGSETTGITLDALAYLLLKHPRCYAAVEAEIDAADAAGRLSPTPRFAETNHDALPYLAACIKETFRVHPPVSLTLPRVVPAGGAVLAGRFFKEGTQVGMSAYVVSRDKALYGADADVFRPERWLEASPERAREMENGMLHFSAGSRMCVGRHIAMMETCKLIPAMLRRFRLRLAEPDREWEILDYTFLKPRAVEVWIERRGK